MRKKITKKLIKQQDKDRKFNKQFLKPSKQMNKNKK